MGCCGPDPGRCKADRDAARLIRTGTGEAGCEPRRVSRRLQLLRRMGPHEQDNEQVSPEVRERAVRLVLDNKGRQGSRWQAMKD
jgi:hypothetical protein